MLLAVRIYSYLAERPPSGYHQQCYPPTIIAEHGTHDESDSTKSDHHVDTEIVCVGCDEIDDQIAEYERADSAYKMTKRTQEQCFQLGIFAYDVVSYPKQWYAVRLAWKSYC